MYAPAAASTAYEYANERPGRQGSAHGDTRSSAHSEDDEKSTEDDGSAGEEDGRARARARARRQRQRAIDALEGFARVNGNAREHRGSGGSEHARAVPLSEPKGTNAHASAAEAETRAHIGEIIRESKSRWLKNTEVCDVLLNYPVYEFGLSLEAPFAPVAGTLFLIDRKTVRFFRKDGHNWQKKKDGKTVRETHEKLKVGTVELLNCYYTHCEDDPRFQRRCYWLLNSDEGAVLVHYLKVRSSGLGKGVSAGSEGRSAHSGGSSGKALEFKRADSEMFRDNSAGRRPPAVKLDTVAARRDAAARQFQSFLSGTFAGDEDSRMHVNDLLSRDDVDLAEIFGEVDFAEDEGHMLMVQQQQEVSTSTLRQPSLSLGSLLRDLHNNQEDDAGMSNERSDDMNSEDDSKKNGEVSPVSLEELERRIQRIRSSLQGLTTDAYAKDKQSIEKQIVDLERSARRRAGHPRQSASFNDYNKDSHSRQRDTEVSTSGTTDGDSSEEEQDAPVSHAPVSRPVERRIPATLTGIHVLWSIVDYSPSWDDIKGGAKVIITGAPQVEFGADVPLCLIFGNVAVTAERLAPNVLRCIAPAHPTGVVSMFITVADGNRHPISEICSFEYVDSKVIRSQNKPGGARVIDEHMSDRDFQYRLIQLLTTMGSDKSSESDQQRSGSGDGGDTRKNTVSYDFMSQSMMHMNALSALRAAASMHVDPFNLDVISDADLKGLFEAMMRARLKSVIVHENRRTKSRLALPQAAVAISQVEAVVKTGLVPDESLVELVVERTYEAQAQLMNLALAPSAYRRQDQSGLTMFHCCAALGIDWAIKAMCATGIDLNHLDNCRRSALHWAVARGHEAVVATLLNAGAKSRICAQWLDKMYTPADLAVACGHMGIAAYISEANLTSALSNIELRSQGVQPALALKVTRDSVTGLQVKRTTLPSDDSGSDDNDEQDPLKMKPLQHPIALRTVTSPIAHVGHRPKKTNKYDEDNKWTSGEVEYDSETEALTVIKRAEFAKKKLYSVMQHFKTQPVYVDAELSTHIAQLGKRRTRQRQNFDMPAGQVQDVMDRLFTPAEELVQGVTDAGRRPAVRARRLKSKIKSIEAPIEQFEPKRTLKKFQVQETLDENEEDIQHDVARIQEIAQSAHARSQYLRLRRIANQLQVELHALSTGIGAEYDED